MQVSDAGKLLRSTLQASKFLMTYRGMQPLMNTRDELDVASWLKRREALEDMDEELFDEIAHTFVAEMLEHDHKHLMLDRVVAAREKRAAKKKAKAKKSRRRRNSDDEEASADDDDDDEAPEEIPSLDGLKSGLHMQGKIYSIPRLVGNYAEFMPHLYPLVFGCASTPDKRRHNKLDYRLALLVHTGRSMKEYKMTLKKVVDRLHRLRLKLGGEFGFEGAAAATMPCRIVVVLWGAPFHPKSGKLYDGVQKSILEFNAAQVACNSNVTVEAWSVVELQYDVTEHEDVGRAYTVIDDPSAVPELRTIKNHQFAYIRVNEPQARARDLRIDQLVRVDRSDFDMAGQSHDYRVVVPGTYVLESTGDNDEEVDEGE